MDDKLLSRLNDFLEENKIKVMTSGRNVYSIRGSSFDLSLTIKLKWTVFYLLYSNKTFLVVLFLAVMVLVTEILSEIMKLVLQTNQKYQASTQ